MWCKGNLKTITIARVSALAAMLLLGMVPASGRPLHPTSKTHECYLYTTSCGSTVDGEITIYGCRYVDSNDTQYWTRYRFYLNAGATVTATVTATEFIPELGIAPQQSSVYTAFNANSSRKNTISITARFTESNYIDVDIYAKSPYTGRFRLKISCAECKVPQFVENPAPTTRVPYGSQATLHAAAIGNELIQYAWYDIADPSFRQGTLQQFQTQPITRTMTFFAQATNECGTTRSEYAVVEPEPCDRPAIFVGASTITVVRGSRVTVEVAAHGTSPLSYQWYEGTPPNTNTVYPGATTNQLIVPSASRSTSFWVRVTNPCGFNDSSAITLNVLAPPRHRSVRH
jgi:hypothetical protein